MSKIKKEMEGYRFNDNDKFIDEEYYYRLNESRALYEVRDRQREIRCSNEGVEDRAIRISREYPSIH